MATSLTVQVTARREDLDASVDRLVQAVRADEALRISHAPDAVPEPAPTWQPIETAPKDGTPILGCRSTWVYPSCMVWLDGPSLIPGWHSFDVSAQGRKPYSPTHWMPLPVPPLVTPDKKGE